MPRGEDFVDFKYRILTALFIFISLAFCITRFLSLHHLEPEKYLTNTISIYIYIYICWPIPLISHHKSRPDAVHRWPPWRSPPSHTWHSHNFCFATCTHQSDCRNDWKCWAAFWRATPLARTPQSSAVHKLRTDRPLAPAQAVTRCKRAPCWSGPRRGTATIRRLVSRRWWAWWWCVRRADTRARGVFPCEYALDSRHWFVRTIKTYIVVALPCIGGCFGIVVNGRGIVRRATTLAGDLAILEARNDVKQTPQLILIDLKQYAMQSEWSVTSLLLYTYRWTAHNVQCGLILRRRTGRRHW